jgi:hypothetical protein
MSRRTDTATLAKAMDALARDIQSGDGVANAAIHEAAERLRELERERDNLLDRLNEILNPPPLKHPHETGGGGMGTLPN